MVGSKGTQKWNEAHKTASRLIRSHDYVVLLAIAKALDEGLPLPAGVRLGFDLAPHVPASEPPTGKIWDLTLFETVLRIVKSSEPLHHTRHKAHTRAISAPPSPTTFQGSGYCKSISVMEAIADIQLMDTDRAFNDEDCLGFALIPDGANKKALRRAPEGLVGRQVTANGELLIRDFGLTYASREDMLKILEAEKANELRAKAGRRKKKIHTLYDATNQMNRINDVFLNNDARFRPDLQPGPCGLSPTLSKMIQLTVDGASVNGALHRLFVSVIPECIPAIDDEHQTQVRVGFEFFDVITVASTIGTPIQPPQVVTRLIASILGKFNA